MSQIAFKRRRSNNGLDTSCPNFWFNLRNIHISELYTLFQILSQKPYILGPVPISSFILDLTTNQHFPAKLLSQITYRPPMLIIQVVEEIFNSNFFCSARSLNSTTFIELLCSMIFTLFNGVGQWTLWVLVEKLGSRLLL